MHSSSENSPFEEITVGSFFDQVSAEYDDSIRKAIPPYQEMFEALIGYCTPLPASEQRQPPLRILELGCGTGNFSLLLRAQFPQAELVLVDLSQDMLKQAEHKLQHLKTTPEAAVGPMQFLSSGFMDLEFEPSQFDLVISSMALHHLLDEEKTVLYQRIFSWLKPNGLFRCADEALAVPALIHERQMSQWEVMSRASGATDSDIALWSQHAEQYDHYASLADHFRWLQASGFEWVDCYWRKLMWSVFGAQKPTLP